MSLASSGARRPGSASRVNLGSCPPQAVVGDDEYLHFRHRMPLGRVRVVEVGGDVQLHSVKVF